MDLANVPNAKKLYLCKCYFKGLLKVLFLCYLINLLSINVKNYYLKLQSLSFGSSECSL